MRVGRKARGIVSTNFRVYSYTQAAHRHLPLLTHTRARAHAHTHAHAPTRVRTHIFPCGVDHLSELLAFTKARWPAEFKTSLSHCPSTTLWTTMWSIPLLKSHHLGEDYPCDNHAPSAFIKHLNIELAQSMTGVNCGKRKLNILN